MILLVTTAHADMVRYGHPNLGRLVQPRACTSVRQTAEAGVPWAADNDCYQGLDARAFLTMLERIEGLPGRLFTVVPDVVGQAGPTLALWRHWVMAVARPRAFVLQDGIWPSSVPWDELDAVFVGGTTGFKVSEQAALLVAEAKRRGKWAHMGRVNSAGRMAYAASIGCDSVDGTRYARWKRSTLRRGLHMAAAPPQLRMEVA